MKFGPSLNEPTLRPGKASTDTIDGIDSVDRRRLLVVRVKVRPMMRSGRFREHADYDSKEARNLRHQMMIYRAHNLLGQGARYRASALLKTRSRTRMSWDVSVNPFTSGPDARLPPAAVRPARLSHPSSSTNTRSAGAVSKRSKIKPIRPRVLATYPRVATSSAWIRTIFCVTNTAPLAETASSR